MVRTVSVKLECNSYDIRIAPRLLIDTGQQVENLLPKAEKIAIITDSNVEKLYLEPIVESLRKVNLHTCTFSIPPGESSKNTAQYISALNFLAAGKLTRSDAIIALGGGVVGDLAGFVAATYLRGVPFIQIPTTLLAMVDSSVGGKTAIDLPSGKNLVGAFHQPALVICDTDTLATLPDEVFRGGCAEVIKHSMMGGQSPAVEALIQKLRTAPLTKQLEAVIADNVIIKRDIVQKDEFDTGVRQLLNFGHTVGHAVEMLSNYEIPHGYAVAIGMATITRAAACKGHCLPECVEVLNTLLADYQLPNQTDYSAESLFKAALGDKKRTGRIITEVVPVAPGKCELLKIPFSEMLEWIEMGLKP